MYKNFVLPVSKPEVLCHIPHSLNSYYLLPKILFSPPPKIISFMPSLAVAAAVYHCFHPCSCL